MMQDITEIPETPNNDETTVATTTNSCDRTLMKEHVGGDTDHHDGNDKEAQKHLSDAEEGGGGEKGNDKNKNNDGEGSSRRLVSSRVAVFCLVVVLLFAGITVGLGIGQREQDIPDLDSLDESPGTDDATLPCSQDPSSCGIIMDGLAPVIPPGSYDDHHDDSGNYDDNGCLQSPSCRFIMDALGPVIPPATKHLFNIPNTCHSKSRDWLRTNDDLLQYDPWRIRQRYTLAMLYCELDGGLWLINNGWLSDMHECSWWQQSDTDDDDIIILTPTYEQSGLFIGAIAGFVVLCGGLIGLT